MKRWEKLADESIYVQVVSHFHVWERFARTGKCLNINCDDCPFNDAEDESMNKCPSYAERVKYLNEEVGGGLSEGA